MRGAAADGLLRGEREEHLGAGAVAELQGADAVRGPLDPVLAVPLLLNPRLGSAVVTDAASTTIEVPVWAAYAEHTAEGGRVAEVKSPADSYQRGSHVTETVTERHRRPPSPPRRRHGEALHCPGTMET